jgi:trk system potassium uptake protein TrkH
MGLNIKAVIRVAGIVSMIVGLAMSPALFVAVSYHESRAVFAFVVTITGALISGGLLMFFVRPESSKIGHREGMLIVSLCWLIASLISALLFTLSGTTDFCDGFFESASGFSTTGATILTDIEAVSKGVLFWRSFTHWLGGMGILVFAVALLPALGIKAFWIAESESPGPTFDKLTPKISDTAKILYLIYIGLSTIQTIMLLAGGMSLFDALTHMFSSMGTGGFSTYNDSIAHFNSFYLEMVLAFFMMASACNYNLYYLLLKGRWKDLLADEELRMFIGIITTFTLLIAVILYLSDTVHGAGESLRQSLFQTISIITTTGFATTDFNLWPNTVRLLLLLLMFIGGCASSTGGAIKVVRIVVLFKLIRRGIYKRLHPLAVIPIKLNGKNLSSDTVSAIASFLTLYMWVMLAGIVLISFDQIELMTTISSVITCLGNVGPGFGLIGPMSNFSLFSAPATLLLSFLMICGRLELFTLLLIFTPSFWKPDR